MEIKKEVNALEKRKPVFIQSQEDVQNAADFLALLNETKTYIQEAYDLEKEGLIIRLKDIEKKYKNVLKLLDDFEGEVRGKVTNYVTKLINQGEVVEKKVKGNIGYITFIADKEVEIEDEKKLLQGVIEGKYPDKFVKVNKNEIKKYIKATNSDVDGVKAYDSVYMRAGKL